MNNEVFPAAPAAANFIQFEMCNSLIVPVFSIAQKLQ